MTKEEKRQYRAAYCIEFYHRTKSRRGINNFVFKTPEEQRLNQHNGERRRYREAQEKLGKAVRHRRPGGSVTKEQLRVEQAKTCGRYKDRHPERRRISAMEWARRNRAAGMARFVERYHTDPVFNISIKIRRRIDTALRACKAGTRKTDRTIGLLGCSYTEFKDHIEKQFTEGMSWAKCFNGRIHLDHIRPCSSFRLEDPDEQRECFSFRNVQPLWARDNLKKHNKTGALPAKLIVNRQVPA